MQIGVIGSWEKDLDSKIYQTAEEVGELIARKGDILLTGGSTGVMEAAMKGAKNRNGLTVGVIPTESRYDYAYLGKHIDIVIATGMGEYGKLACLIHSVDGVIAIAGGAGTLIEMCMAYLQNKPVVVIPIPGHTTDRIMTSLVDGCLDHRKIRPLAIAKTAQEAVQILYEELEKRPPRTA